MVEWKEAALDRLADLYVKAPDAAAREAIARCVERINAQLAANPWGPGEDRGPGRRVWFTPPWSSDTTCRRAAGSWFSTSPRSRADRPTQTTDPAILPPRAHGPRPVGFRVSHP